MKYKEVNYKYVLAEDETFKSDIMPPEAIHTDFITLLPNGQMVLKAGYAWDGCSGPTKDDKTNITPSAFHDASYQLFRKGLLSLKWKHIADYDFICMCRERGMWSIRAWYYHKALKRFGSGNCSPGSIRPILELP